MCETWSLTKEDIQKLEAMEMWIWRKMESVSWKDHVPNETVLQRLGEKLQLIKTIRERQAIWISQWSCTSTWPHLNSDVGLEEGEY